MFARYSMALCLLLAGPLAGCGSNQGASADRAPGASPAATLAQAPDWSQAETVEITLASFRFTPDQVQLRRGAAYHLRLVNRSDSAHNFTSERFFHAVLVREAGSAGAATPTTTGVEIAPGESKTVDLVAVEPGSYAFECTHFLHAAFGMTGTITIR